MAFVTGREALTEIGTWAAEQMGIEPNDVKRIAVDLNCDDIVTAKVTVVWTGPLVEGLKEHLSRFKLAPLTAKVEDDSAGEYALRRLVDAAEAVTANGVDESLRDRVLELRRAAQRMRELVPEEGDE